MARWLIEAAQTGDLVTYREAQKKLTDEVDFTTVFSIDVGKPAGEMMDRMLAVDPRAPLLNTLLVQTTGRRPGIGAGLYMARRYGQPWLSDKASAKARRNEWNRYADQAIEEAYRYPHWRQLYQSVFGQPYPASPAMGKWTEPGDDDGVQYGRGGGEGPHHRELRYWVRDNPGHVRPRLVAPKTDTEVDLASGDRVDVVYEGIGETVLIEVKSRISNNEDLRRGVYQCIKYRAVRQASDGRTNPNITALLITEYDLPDSLVALAKSNNIETLTVPPDRKLL